MYIKIVMLVMFVFSSSSVFAKEIQFEDLSADVQEELLSGLNNKERAATGYVKKNPPKKVVVKKSPVKKNVPDAAFLKAVARQLEMNKLDADVEAFKKKEAEKASARVETASQPVVNVVLPRDEVAEKVWVKKINHILASTSTARAFSLKRMNKKIASAISPLELGLGLRLSTYRSEEAINPERGFGMASSNQTGVRLGLSVQAKYKMFGLEYVASKSSDKLDLEFYGTSLGSLKIITGPALIAKVFVIDQAMYALSFGLGIERVKVNGSFSIGGFEAVTKYNKTPTIIQIGGMYKVHEDISLGANYELSNFRISSEFPGVPDLVFNRGGCLVFTANWKMFKP